MLAGVQLTRFQHRTLVSSCPFPRCLRSFVKCNCGIGPVDYEQEGGSTGCTMACPGDERQVCGGPDATSVYRVHDASVIGEKCDLCQEMRWRQSYCREKVLQCTADDNAIGYFGKIPAQSVFNWLCFAAHLGCGVTHRTDACVWFPPLLVHDLEPPTARLIVRVALLGTRGGVRRLTVDAAGSFG